MPLRLDQEILVRLGQQVRQGDILVRLDNTMTASDLGELEAIEAKIKPADIAFIRACQPVMVEITAYDFSIYGGLDGVVEYVPSDSVYDEQARETFYTVVVKTDHSALDDKGRKHPIMPGMIARGRNPDGQENRSRLSAQARAQGAARIPFGALR
jgi:multidrug efflux pump subunit AcrA (membrane-fusion protein)